MKQRRRGRAERCQPQKSAALSALSALQCIAAAMIFVAATGPTASFGQTRAECNKCCQEMFTDDYYIEQCKLKCFRDHGHCNTLRAARGPGSRPGQHQPQPSVERQVPKPETPTAAEPPAAQPPQEAPQRRPERAATRQAPFVWPETLVLNPGREWEAAGQILAANGIPPQHPNYTPALKAIEQVLIDFARTNPGGGELPTDQLERIIMQARR